jgi:hypothetical protein
MSSSQATAPLAEVDFDAELAALVSLSCLCAQRAFQTAPAKRRCLFPSRRARAFPCILRAVGF